MLVEPCFCTLSLNSQILVISYLSTYAFRDVSDTLKTEVPELGGLGYMEDVAGLLGNLLTSPLKDVRCVESIVFSSFNPPPSYRR